MKKEVFKVEGMACEHCEKRAEKAISAENGIKSCKASFKEKTIVCEYDENVISHEAILELIDDIGFEAVK